MRPSYVALIAGVLLFVSGLALGQKTNSTKLSKYEQPANISKMEWHLLQARVDSMHWRFPISDGVGLPDFVFEKGSGIVTAYILVGHDVIEREPAEQLRRLLRDRAIDAQSFVLHYMPEVSDANFIVYYRALEKGQFITLAEYKNGELSIH